MNNGDDKHVCCSPKLYRIVLPVNTVRHLKQWEQLFLASLFYWIHEMCFLLSFPRFIQSAAPASPSFSRVVSSFVRRASPQGRSSSTSPWRTGWTYPPSRPACPATLPASPALAPGPQTACPARLTVVWCSPPACTRTRSSVNPHSLGDSRVTQRSQKGRTHQQQTTAKRARNPRGSPKLRPLSCLPSWPCSAVPSSWQPSWGSSSCCKCAQVVPLWAGGPSCLLCIPRQGGWGWPLVSALAKDRRGKPEYATRGSPLCGGTRTWSPTSLNQTVRKWTVTVRGQLLLRRRAQSSWTSIGSKMWQSWYRKQTQWKGLTVSLAPVQMH